MKQEQNKQISKSFLLLFQADYSYTKTKRLWSSDPPDNWIRHTVIVSGSELKQTYNKYSKAPLKGLLEVINSLRFFFGLRTRLRMIRCLFQLCSLPGESWKRDLYSSFRGASCFNVKNYSKLNISHNLRILGSFLYLPKLFTEKQVP